MTSDGVYRKIGRGGAGNFYAASETTAQDPENKDLEAQKQQQQQQQQPDANHYHHHHHHPTAPARAGRGGAGNFISADPQDVADSERAAAEDTMSAVRSHHQAISRTPPAALSGRGGVGNWKTTQQQQQQQYDDEERRRGAHELEDLEQKVRDAVDQDLKMPEKVHHAVDKQTGR